MFQRIYYSFCASMGLYGYTRGYRSTDDFNSKNEKFERLTSDKIASGIINALYYATPIINTWPALRLINRIEIEYKDLDKNKYESSYTELTGKCDETF